MYLTDFFPDRCLGCGVMGERLCSSCSAGLRILRFQRCFGCKRNSPQGKVCRICKGQFVLDGVYCVFASTLVLRRFVHGLKYRSKTRIPRAVVDGMRQVCRRYDLDRCRVTFVPMHWAKQVFRGYNQSELLARHLSGRSCSLLKRLRFTRSQVGLSKRERMENQYEAFVCNNEIEGPILLVDDILTTGATLNACASALKKAGAWEVYGLVLGRGTGRFK